MKIKYPTRFEVCHSERNVLNYSGQKNKDLIKEKLTKVSNGYCMYCGNLLVVNNKNMGHLEHTIEKKQNTIEIKYLKHCKYNISIACPVCNTSLKKNMQQISIDNLGYWTDNCNQPCSTYITNCEVYKKLNNIILLPGGSRNGADTCYLEIDYNLLRLRYEPKLNHDYSDEDKMIIDNHISKFMMNSEKYMPIDILLVCEFVVKYLDIPDEKYNNNVIADIFINKLRGYDDFDNVLKLCRLILIMSAL
ncbi:MAG: hypothetical protein ACPKQO_03960 [Nitrososphaeraceae archaeon]